MFYERFRLGSSEVFGHDDEFIQAGFFHETGFFKQMQRTVKVVRLAVLLNSGITFNSGVTLGCRVCNDTVEEGKREPLPAVFRRDRKTQHGDSLTERKLPGDIGNPAKVAISIARVAPADRVFAVKSQVAVDFPCD